MICPFYRLWDGRAEFIGVYTEGVKRVTTVAKNGILE